MEKTNMSELLLRLMNTFGVSGHEEEVRALIQKEIKPYVDSIEIDPLGNLIARKTGEKPKVMLAAHMDEIGLMVKSITEKGHIRFSEIGGFQPINLIGHTVKLRAKEGFMDGVITTNEINNDYDVLHIPRVRDMYIDTGLRKNDLERKGIEIGSYISFESKNTWLGSKDLVCGKALDDRIGCYMLIELAKRVKNVQNELYFVFTVQEEIGLYGAKTSAYEIEPDWALAVDTTNANDANEEPTKSIGSGPCLTIKDQEMISNKCITDWLKEAAKKNHIPLQIEVSNFGTTDALNISMTKGGVPSAVLSIAIRNPHTTNGIAHMKDIQNGIDLLEAVLKGPPSKCLPR